MKPVQSETVEQRLQRALTVAKQVKIDFRNFQGLDLATAKKISLAHPRANLPGEEAILRSTLGVLASPLSLLQSLLDVVHSPQGSISTSGSIPGVRIRSPSPDFTISDGFAGAAGAGINLGAGGGIYFWNKRPNGEIGLYGSLSIGLISNLAFSLGTQIGILFGKAADTLGGNSISVSIDIDIGFGAVAGSLILTPPLGGMWPPTSVALATWKPEVEGIGFGLSVGMGALPVSISVMPSHTWLRPFKPGSPLLF